MQVQGLWCEAFAVLIRWCGHMGRLATNRALAGRPSLLMLDEPTEGIQPSVIKGIGRVLRRLAQQGLGGQPMAI